jgi:hypothetical protein
VLGLKTATCLQALEASGSPGDPGQQSRPAIVALTHAPQVSYLKGFKI